MIKTICNNILSGQSFEGTMSEFEFQERCKMAREKFDEFLIALGYDINNDPNMKETSKRFVKMLTREIARGTYEAPPKITVFENQYLYSGIVFEGGIDVKSLCSHHLAFIKGKAYVAYIPGNKVIGLSKLNRIVDWFARRPQLQEQLTVQIHDYISRILDCKDVAVLIEAEHMCVSMRGVENSNSYTTTSKLSGVFLDQSNLSRHEFYNMINRK